MLQDGVIKLAQRQDDKTTVLKIIDKMLTTKKFKEFFQKNVAML